MRTKLENFIYLALVVQHNAEKITLSNVRRPINHTARTAIDRMIDSVDHEIQQQVRHQLSDALQAVISQRLIPRKNNPGRMVAVECMRNTTSIANMIRESKGAQMVSAIQAGGEDGMVLLESSLAQLVKRGMIDVEDAHVNARYHAILNRYLEK